MLRMRFYLTRSQLNSSVRLTTNHFAVRLLPLLAFCGVSSLLACHGSDNQRRRTPTNVGSNADSTFALATGTWDWYAGESTCVGNTHTLSFSSGRDTMIIAFKQPLASMGGQRVFRYKILGVGSRVLPPFQYVVRGAMEGETRRTAGGELAVWDLLLLSPNRYHWHRSDWQVGQGTRAILRCSGDKPLEHWDSAGFGRPTDSPMKRPN